MPKDNFVIPGMNNAPKEYVFNSLTKFPDEVQSHLNNFLAQHAGKPYRVDPHAEVRSQERMSIPADKVPGLNGKFPTPDLGWKPFEVRHNGKNVTSVGMRGPYDGSNDVTMTFKPGPLATTAWINDKNDTHNSLQQEKVHFPEEYQSGKPPRRRLLNDDEMKAMNKLPTRWDSQKGKMKILKQYGYEPQVKNASFIIKFITRCIVG